MLSVEDNRLITQTGPGTPGGEFLRRYWHPVALSEEVPPGGAPVPLRIMGEDLVLFRDETGALGLLARRCAHRCADLSFGRIEDGGLRCLYHGWLYDRNGACLEQPGEPPGSTFHEKVRQQAYVVEERVGMVFAYMGPGEPPLLPGYEFWDVPDERWFAFKTYHECNWLQGNEGSVDPVHTSFVHRFLDDPDPGFMAVEGFEGTHQDLLKMDTHPTIEVRQQPFGLTTYSLRPVPGARTFVRVESVLFPNGGAYGGPMADPKYRAHGVNWHVPVDDHNHWKFLFMYSNKDPIPKERVRERCGETTPDYHMVRNASNRYLQDRGDMVGGTFSGFGESFNVHDHVMIESMGSIVDRSQEHLGAEDKSVILYRRMLLDGIKDVAEGRDPYFVVRDPESNVFRGLAGHRVVPNDKDFFSSWMLDPEATTA